MHLTHLLKLFILILHLSLGLIMFGGEFLTSFVPEVGVQEQMREHGKDPLWKIKYELQNLLLVKILFSVRNLSRYRR